MGPSLVRGSSVVRGFDGQNISSQKLRTTQEVVTVCRFVIQISIIRLTDDI